MNSTLSSVDYSVILVYLGGMIGLGVYLSRRKKTEEEYFLAGRGMPWFAVGMSVIASLLSSLTYLSEPGEVWRSGVTHVVGKMLAIPIEVIVVWIFCVPFMMKFRFTSAYEYLEHRFGRAARKLGVWLFLLMVVLWMGFVVLASANALVAVSAIRLEVVVGTIGLVATLYTMLGGLRAVIWTDVIQVTILIGGGAFTMAYVAWTTGTWLPDWYAATVAHLATLDHHEPIPWHSFDPTVRATVLTVALNMTVWHVCTHVANQMTVQRYFSTTDTRAARRSFLTASLFGVGLNLMLVGVGLAVLYYYKGQGILYEGGDTAGRAADLIFPTFAVSRLPDGVGGAILAALLAAAMSTIDSGINSIATVLTVERTRDRREEHIRETRHVRIAMMITLAAGLFITFAAFALSFLPDRWGIVGAMPRTFNAITAPLGGLFLVGMFMPRVGQKAVLAGTGLGLATSLTLGYFQQLGEWLHEWGWLAAVPPEISFTWIMPSALLVTICSSFCFSFVFRDDSRETAGYTWRTRHSLTD
jgi:solute:Na+ symporter, SSS family